MSNDPQGTQVIENPNPATVTPPEPSTVIPPIDDEKMFILEQENMELKRKLDGIDNDEILSYAKKNPSGIKWYKEFDDFVAMHPDKKQAILSILAETGSAPSGDQIPNPQDPLLQDLKKQLDEFKGEQQKQKEAQALEKSKQEWREDITNLSKHYPWLKNKVVENAVLMRWANNPGWTKLQAVKSVEADLKADSSVVNIESLSKKLQAPIIQGKGGSTQVDNLPDAPDNLSSSDFRKQLKARYA